MSIHIAIIIIVSVFILLLVAGIIYIIKYRRHFAFNKIKSEADNGRQEAMLMLGYIYYSGSNNQKQDIDKAIEYFSKAILAGSTQAEYLLGGIYVEGKNVAQDTQKGVGLIKSAADKGNPIAQRSIAGMFADGNLIEKNDSESVKYFMLAAANGDLIAQKTVAGIYHFTVGFDKKIAYSWYSLASEQNDKYATDMAEQLMNELPPEEKIVADKMAKEYKLKFGKNLKIN